MKLLELFSGTHSVGKVAQELGWEVTSLDIDGKADINCDILDWDYRENPVGYYDVIWASPPCCLFSNVRRSCFGRKLKRHGGLVFNRELMERDIQEEGLPIVRRTEEIIDYYQPKAWIIENPKSSLMKDYLTHRPSYVVDYCKYSDWGYKKPTRLWTNIDGFRPKVCRGDCENRIDGGRRHRMNLGNLKDGRPYVKGGGNDRDTRFRVPPSLVKDLFSCIN
jgi:site-specific DNA-cytosine methylase